MCKYFIRFIILLWLLLPSQLGWTKTKPHIKMYLPTGLQIGFDVFKPAYTNLLRKKEPQYKIAESQYEFNGLLDFKRLLLQVDYGWGLIKREGSSMEKIIDPKEKRVKKVTDSQGNRFYVGCLNEGKYFRIGVDYNFISNSIDDNAAFLGLRYAKSYFRNQISSTLPDEYKQSDKTTVQVWGDYEVNHRDQTIMQARWFEIVGGFRVKAWKWVYIGCTARYKFNPKILPNPHYIPFDIIGWGINGEQAFGLSVYALIRLPLQARNFTDSQDQTKIMSDKK